MAYQEFFHASKNYLEMFRFSYAAMWMNVGNIDGRVSLIRANPAPYPHPQTLSSCLLNVNCPLCELGAFHS